MTTLPRVRSCLLGFALALACAPLAAGAAPLPEFSWDHVPSAADFHTEKTLTPAEAQFIATHYALVSLEKGQGLKSMPDTARFTEDGFVAATRTLKAINPRLKVLFYWNSILHYPLYRASKSFDPGWCVHAPGKNAQDCRHDELDRIHYDRANPGFRKWWTTTAVDAVRGAGADGVFVDAVGKTDYDPLLTMLESLSSQLRASGQDLIIFNDPPGPKPRASSYPLLTATSGFMLEQFDRPVDATPEQLKAELMFVRQAGRIGKVVLFKAWPGFTFMEPETAKIPYAERVARARKNITFPLACFLVAAQRYAYFQYSWSWVEPGGGNLIYRDDGVTLDPDWYPELMKPLGAPKGEAVIDGFRFHREFAHASVSVDLKAHTSQIDWH